MDDEIETARVHRTRAGKDDKYQYLVFHCVFILTTATRIEQKEGNEGREKEDEALCGDKNSDE